MTEDKVEGYLVERVEATGGLIRKVVFPARRGAPDRLCGWPNGRHGFVETKRPKGKPEAHQEREHDRLRSVGFDVAVIATREAVDEYVERMSG